MCCIMLTSLSVLLLRLDCQPIYSCFVSFFIFIKSDVPEIYLRMILRICFFFFSLPIRRYQLIVGYLEATFQRFAKFNIGPSCIYCRSLRNPPSLPASLTGAGVHDKAFGSCRRLLIFRMSISGDPVS